MSTDRYLRRRMAIGKYNNRPPFDIKKSDDSTSVEIKEQREQNPTTPLCCNCEKRMMNTAAKSYRNVVKYFEEIDGKYQNSMRNKNKNIIPKIIESFQKVTPKQQSNMMGRKQKSDSLHTLYRNNSPNFGRNIPEHKLMRSLLKGCDNEKGSIDQGDYIDEIPSRDVSENTDVMKTNYESNIRVRVDKQTSTSELVWPINSKTKNNFQTLKVSKSTPFNKNMGTIRSKIPQMRDTRNTEKTYITSKVANADICVTNKYSSNSELEYFPTKDNQHVVGNKRTEKINGVNKVKFPQHKFIPKSEGFKKEHTYVVHVDRNVSAKDDMGKRKKEKSFVQVQVEKYNRINNNKNIRSKVYVSNNSIKPKNFEESRKNVNKNYIDLMSSIRETLPNFGERCAGDSADNHDWSDPAAEAEIEVKFPRETRNAMENLMANSRRIPLTKYAKSQSIHIQPAIPIVSQPKTDYGDHKKSPLKRINQLPCSKNLLCSRGNHEGPCKLERVSVTNNDQPRMRPKHNEFVK